MEWGEAVRPCIHRWQYLLRFTMSILHLAREEMIQDLVDRTIEKYFKKNVLNTKVAGFSYSLLKFSLVPFGGLF